MNNFKNLFGVSAIEFCIRMAIIMAVLIICTSCKSPESIVSNNSKEEHTASTSESKQDAKVVEKYIYKDSVYYKEVVINDTVYKMQYKYRYLDKVVHDTLRVYINKTDTVYIKEESNAESVIVEKESWWQRQKGELIWTIILAIIAIIVTIIYKRIKK